MKRFYSHFILEIPWPHGLKNMTGNNNENPKGFSTVFEPRFHIILSTLRMHNKFSEYRCYANFETRHIFLYIVWLKGLLTN